MKRSHRVGLVVMVMSLTGIIWRSGTVEGAEHGGKEHGGVTTAATAATPASTAPAPAPIPAPAPATTTTAGRAQPPSAEQIRQAVEAYVQEVIDEDGSFRIEDPVTNTMRSLTLERVHERVGKTGELYYSCTDMKDATTGETLDLDYDLDHGTGGLEVVDVRIHKVNGQPRYTYNDQDQRVPVAR